MAQVALAARQDVALAASPALGQRHETARDVTGVDVRKPAGRVDSHEPAQVALHVPGRDAVHVAGAEQEAGVRDHDVCFRLEEELLAGPLGRRVRKARSPGRKRLRLVRGPVRSGRRADRRDTRDVHEPCARLDPLQDAHGAVHVRLAQERQILRLVGDSAGQVEDELTAGRRRADVVRGELPAENLDAHRLERARIRPRAHQSAKRVAAFEKQRDQMTSEEPGRPCEEDPHRRAYWRLRSKTTSRLSSS